MTDKPYNVDLLMQVREKIVTEPERHKQSSWAFSESDPREGGACGSAYCVAGWATVLDGHQLNWYQSGSVWGADYTEDGQSIWGCASAALGLDDDEEDTLFAARRTRATVLDMLDRLIEAGKNGERIPYGEL